MLPIQKSMSLKKQHMTNLSIGLNQIISSAITGPSTISHVAYRGWVLVGALEFLWENSMWGMGKGTH